MFLDNWVALGILSNKFQINDAIFKYFFIQYLMYILGAIAFLLVSQLWLISLDKITNVYWFKFRIV